MDTVLVTGGSGFVGSHVILQLLHAGYDVRTTVRSLAREAGVRAMLNGAGADANQRFRLGDAARRVPTRELPSWIVRVAALFDRNMKTLVPLLDTTRRATSAKAERVLEWRPRPREEAIVATAESLLRFGIVT